VGASLCLVVGCALFSSPLSEAAEAATNFHPTACGGQLPPSARVPPFGYTATLELASTRLRNDDALGGLVRFEGVSRAPVRVMTNDPVDLVVTRPGTRHVETIVPAGIGTAMGFTLHAGQVRSVDTAQGSLATRCGRLHPGHYDVVAEISGPDVVGPGAYVGPDGRLLSPLPTNYISRPIAIQVLPSS
jgi:hypothetical protein